MSYADTLNDINTQYHYSVSTAELWQGIEQLYNLTSGDKLIESLKQLAESLYLKMVVKVRFLEYLRHFKGAVYSDLLDYIDEESVKAEKLGYKKSLEVMLAAKKLIGGINGKITQINDIKAAVSDASGEESALASLKALEKIESTVRNITYVSPFGDEVEFVDIGACILNYISEVKRRAESILNAEYDKLAKEHFKEVSPAYTLSEYFPMPEYDEGGKSNAIILSTPFEDEALLYCAHDGREGAKLYILDSAKLNSLSESVIGKIIEIAVKLNYDFCATNVTSLTEAKRKKLCAFAIAAGKSGIKAFIHDPVGDDCIYQNCLKLCIEEGLKPGDISRTYVSMPAFMDVFHEFESKQMMTASDVDKLREMPFIGFYGLNKVVTSFIAGADWFKAGRKLSKYNETAALEYLRKLKTSYLLLDSGWGDFSANNKKVVETEGFDYDGIKEIDRENVRRIIESNSTVFAKCGMIARYCTLGGGDVSDWLKMERAEVEERVELATKLVFRIMKVDIVPEVEVLDKLENATAGGTCYDGGKRIVYKFSECRNWNWMVDAIVHESFHAMQAKLTNGGWSDWYFTNFGITRGRVERWRISRKIYNQNTNSDVYKVHIYENDAYAFEIDCDDGRNYYWNTIDLQ